MFLPVPVVTIAGVDVASGPGSGGLMVVDGLSMTWGRDDLFEQPTPATARLVLFDPTATWATSVDRRGHAVTLSWAGDVPGAGPVRVVFFRGRLGTPTVSRKKVRINGETIKGALVELPLTSVVLDLANQKPTVDWPDETVAARRDRLAALSAATLPGGIEIRDYWLAPHMAPVAAKDQRDLLGHIMDLYDSTGVDRGTFRPDLQKFTYTPRRDYGADNRGNGRLFKDPVGADRYGQGAYVRGIGNTVTMPYLDAQALSHDGNIVMAPKITRVEHRHPSGSTSAYAITTYVLPVPGANELRDGVRAVRLDSQLSWDNYAQTAAEDLVEMSRWEARAWQLQDLTFSTRRTGGFSDVELATLLLNGWEDYTRLIFIERSEFTALGVIPVFGLMGGTIAFREGHWDLLLKTTSIRSGLYRHAITFEEIDDGTAGNEVQWWDDDHPNGMHESLTFEDLGFTRAGLGVAAADVGPNTGFDEENYPS